MVRTSVDIGSNMEVDDDDQDIGPIRIEDDALPFLIGVGILLLIVMILVKVLIGICVVRAINRIQGAEE
ncbi:MAG: hypothetical protein ACMUHB_03270 [Thermoplasmatota archaeon]